MPLVTCPKCPTTLRIPDGSLAAVRCPKCQTVFQPPAPKKPAFEIINESVPSPPPAPPRPKPAGSGEFELLLNEPLIGPLPLPKPTVPPPPPKPEPVVWVDGESNPEGRDPRSNPRPRGRGRDEDDRRPRGRGRDEDDSRSRPRNWDERDDDWDREDELDETAWRNRKASRLGLARVGLLLILISFACYLGSLGLHALFLFIAWLGGVIPSGLIVVTGLFGLTNWAVGLIGIGLTIPGPTRSRGLAIAALAIALIHFVMGFVVASDTKAGAHTSQMIEFLSGYNREERLAQIQKDLAREVAKNPKSTLAKDLKEELASYSGGGEVTRSALRWGDLTTQIPILDNLINLLVYSSRGFSNSLPGMFAGVAELARLILLTLLIGSLASVVRSRDAASKARFGMIGACLATGIGMLILLLLGVIVDSYMIDLKTAQPPSISVPPPTFNGQANIQEFQRQHAEWQRQSQAELEKQQEKMRTYVRGIKNWRAAGELIIYALHGGVLIFPILAALRVHSATRRRMR